MEFLNGWRSETLLVIRLQKSGLQPNKKKGRRLERFVRVGQHFVRWSCAWMASPLKPAALRRSYFPFFSGNRFGFTQKGFMWFFYCWEKPGLFQ